MPDSKLAKTSGETMLVADLVALTVRMCGSGLDEPFWRLVVHGNIEEAGKVGWLVHSTGRPVDAAGSPGEPAAMSAEHWRRMRFPFAAKDQHDQHATFWLDGGKAYTEIRIDVRDCHSLLRRSGQPDPTQRPRSVGQAFRAWLLSRPCEYVAYTSNARLAADYLHAYPRGGTEGHLRGLVRGARRDGEISLKTTKDRPPE